MKLDRLAALFGGPDTRKRREPERVAGRDDPSEGDYSPPHVDTRSRAQRARERLIDAKEKERAQWKRYLASRESRLRRLRETCPGVARYIKTLDRITPDLEVIGWEDCNFDLAELATRCGLDRLPSAYDRFTLFELTCERIRDCRERQGDKRLCDDEASLAVLDKGYVAPETAVSLLKAALQIT